MKKIFTIMLVAAGTISFASAQSHKSIAYNDSKKIDNYNQHPAFSNTSNAAYKNSYFSHNEKEAKLGKINYEFDQKISFVKNDRHVRGQQKAKQIRLLQDQRRNEISKVEFQYAINNHKIDNKVYGHDSHKW